MNLLTLSSLSLAGILLAAPAVAAVAPSHNDRAVRSAPGLAFEHPADELAATMPGESLLYGRPTDLFSNRDPDRSYDLRVALDANAILGTRNLYAVLYTDGDALEPLFTIDDFTLRGPARGDVAIEAALGHSTELGDAPVERLPSPLITGSDGAIAWLALPALVDAGPWTTDERPL